jgi:hypothetical protein
MCPITRSPMLQPLFSPFRRSQQQNLARMPAVMAEVAQATALAVAGHLAVQCGMRGGRALPRGSRPRCQERLDDQLPTAQRLHVRHPGRAPWRT